MPEGVQLVSTSWTISIPFTLVAIFVGIVYLRGWIQLRAAAVDEVPVWRATSFLAGVCLIWLAVGSPISHLDEASLTVHMVQHLLLMTFAPPLILAGAPVMPMVRGLPRMAVQSFAAPIFRWPVAQRAGRVLSQPAVCWFAATAALVGWHIPAAFDLARQSMAWHMIEHGTFLMAGFLFWWPVIQPWPSVPAWPRWSILLYLFSATLPCDILSAYLTFCDKVVYTAYLKAPSLFGLSALEDQQCAGALMWTCVTLVYLLPAAQITIRLLAPNSRRSEFVEVELERSSSRSPGSYS
jgi:putative membrane protein